MARACNLAPRIDAKTAVDKSTANFVLCLFGAIWGILAGSFLVVFIKALFMKILFPSKSPHSAY